MQFRREQRRRGEEGSALIMVSVAIAALLAFGIVAIDGVILMTTKTQLQGAADAAALAGASGLMHSEDEAITRAIEFAAFNSAVQESLSPVIITEDDIAFPSTTRIRVTTHRTAATGDPLRTYFLRLVDLLHPNTADISAVATAELMEICGTDCLKPWGVPDRWDDVNGNGEWDEGEPYDPIGTGYLPPDDVGVSIILKIGNPQQSPQPGHFLPICFPPLGGSVPPETGGDIYREWIRECCPWTVEIGDSLQIEPGNMVGPTMQAVSDLVNQDPTAYWDEGTNTVRGSAFGRSPRVILVPYIDPSRPPDPGRQVVHVTKIGAFFLEGVGQNNSIYARFMQLATQGEPCDPDDPPSFIVGVVLVE